MHYFSTLFGKELYMFRTNLLSIIGSFITAFAAIGICHASYVDCLSASEVHPDLTSRETVNIKLRNSAACWLLLQEYNLHHPRVASVELP